MWRVGWEREGKYAVHRPRSHATRSTATRNAATPNVLMRSGPKVSASALTLLTNKRSVSANVAAKDSYGAREGCTRPNEHVPDQLGIIIHSVSGDDMFPTACSMLVDSLGCILIDELNSHRIKYMGLSKPLHSIDANRLGCQNYQVFLQGKKKTY